MKKSIFDIIKKQNGERFAQAIRNNGILEVPDIDKIVKYAGRDATPILNYLVSLKQIQIEEQSEHQDPIALLDKAGYNAYVADTLEKQNAIKKYYARGEELCTFRTTDRFKYYYIINAVRKDVDKIKRKDFTKPERDDRYGTSVISIQVLKTGGFISIKNRYNHTVLNCDNTFNSNPDKIIEGLSDAIKHYFGVDFSSHYTPLPDGYTLINNQIYKYQNEIENVYFGENSYACDGKIYNIDKNSQLMLGNGLLLDIKSKSVKTIARNALYYQEKDFLNSLNQTIENKKLRITKKSTDEYNIFTNNNQILTVKNGEITNIKTPNSYSIFVKDNSNLEGDLDFSGTMHIGIKNSNLDKVKSINFSDSNDIRMSHVTLPAIELDFSTVTPTCFMGFYGTNFNQVKSIKLPKATNDPFRYTYFSLANCTLPSIDLDFGGITSASIMDCNLTNLKSIKFPHKNFSISLENVILPHKNFSIRLENVILPACEIDFKDVEISSLKNVDFGLVKKVKNAPLKIQAHWVKDKTIELFRKMLNIQKER